MRELDHLCFTRMLFNERTVKLYKRHRLTEKESAPAIALTSLNSDNVSRFFWPNLPSSPAALVLWYSPSFFIDGSAPPGCCQNSPLWVWEGPSARLCIVFKATPLLSHRLHKHRRNSGRQTSQSSRAVCFHAEATCCSHDAGKGRSLLLMLLLLSSSLSRSRDPDLCQEACGRVCVHSRVRRIL